MKYTNIDDHSALDKMADMIILNVKHEFNEAELKQEADMLAQCVSDKQLEEANKKVAMSVFKNKIDTLQGKINSHASNINHGFTYIDKATTLYRDFDNKRRVYFDKQTGDYLKDEAFHPSDYQKKLEFDQQQEQIDENNSAGNYAEQTPDENGMYIGNEGNLTDIPPKSQSGTMIGDALDNVIANKSKLLTKAEKAAIKNQKLVPKDNLGPHYNNSAEFEVDDNE